MKLLNKIILLMLAVGFSAKAMAYNLPPVTSQEVKQQADYLMQHKLYNSAKKYYRELDKRGDKLNALWGLTLINIANNKNMEALKKVNFLLKQDKVKARVLENLQAELLVTLAEQNYAENNREASVAYLNSYFQKENGQYNIQQRAKELKEKIKGRFSQEQINIGVILPLSGKLASVGKKIEKALTLSLYNQKLNNINLYFEDNKSSQEGSIQAATKIMSKNVKMVVGPILRDNVLAANTVLIASQTPIFAFSNDESIAGRNIFLNNINLKQEAYEITRFAADNNNKRFACLAPDNAYGDTQKASFENSVHKLGRALESCESFDASNIDVNKPLKRLLEIDKNERLRLAELKKLEKEFETLGNAMDDDKIARMHELKNMSDVYDINFNAIFLPTSAKKVKIIAPQLAFYDIDFSNGVLFLGTSSWDDKSILNNRGEHLHFSRFLSLKSDAYKEFAKQYKIKFASQPNLLAGFAYDVLKIAKELDFSKNIYTQLHKPQGFSVLTGNVKFDENNMPNRVYGVSKISRRKIKPVINVAHTRPVTMPRELTIEKSSGFGNWFGF